MFHIFDLGLLYNFVLWRPTIFWITILAFCVVGHYLAHNFTYCSIIRMSLHLLFLYWVVKSIKQLFYDDIEFDLSFDGSLGGKMFVHKPKHEIPPINPENPNLISMTFKDTRTN